MQTAQHDATRILDRYALLEEIGSGGFGSVWLARDERLERLVAVKRIPVTGAAAAARAEKEALAAARLSHPAVVSLFEAGRDDGAVYLVSELVRGHTLHELLAEGALSDRDVVLIGMAMCDALAHAHARGVVHRDVKPGNVLVPDGGFDPAHPVVAKLTDFGIARITGDDALTATGDIVGTLAYMAPEQAAGRGATAASDLYSLGLVLYEALCGVNPVRGANAAATARRVGMRLPALRRMRRDLPRGLCAAIDAALQPDPAMRGSLDSLRLALAEALAGVGDEPGTVEAPWAPWSPGETPPQDAGEEELPARSRPFVSVPARLAGGAVTGGAAAAALSLADTAPPVQATVAVALAAGITALLPRVGWLAVTATLVAWLAGEGRPDAWWAVALAALPAPALVPLRPAWWSAPSLAVGLGWIGAGLAWPAVAGQARGAWTRAVLGAAGFWTVALLGMLLQRRLLLAPAPGMAELVRDPALAVAAVWAAAAAVLPVLVRGRNVGADLLAAVAWAVALAFGTQAAAGGDVRGLAGAAALAALLAVFTGALRRT